MIDTNKARELAVGIKTDIGYGQCPNCDRDRYCPNCHEIVQAAALLLQFADAHDSMAKDAARYRHAVENAYVWGSVSAYSVQQDAPVAFWIKSNVPMDKAGIDEQIDAAMGADNG